MFVAHGVAADFEGEDLTVADDVAEGDTFGGFDGFDGLAGGDASEEGEAVVAFFGRAGGEDVDGAAAVVCALEEALILEIGDVFMDGGEGAESQAGGDLLVGGGVAVLLGEAGEKVDDLFLTPRDSHVPIVANKKRTAMSKWIRGGKVPEAAVLKRDFRLISRIGIGSVRDLHILIASL